MRLTTMGVALAGGMMAALLAPAPAALAQAGKTYRDEADHRHDQ